jgi:predicted phage terminase large subunit-like protein
MARTLGDIRRAPLVPTTFKPNEPDMSSATRGIRVGSSPTGSKSRVEACRHDIEKFAITYFPHHFSRGFCELHKDIFEQCDAPAPPAGKRVARCAPRKFGKTTIISLVKPLHDIAYQRKHFVLLIGESATTAEANLATISQELDNNEKLLEDFPHLAPAKDAKGQMVKWTDRQLVFKNFATILAKGMGARMRGLKYRQMRPDLAILDDPESPETADTFLKRRRHKRWFGGTFMGLGSSDWDLYVIGNLPHHDCLLADLLRDPQWSAKLYRAINRELDPEGERYPIGNTKSDGSALWPEEWGLPRLEAYKREPNVGSLGFAREMMNDPRDEESKVFNLTEFTFYDMTWPDDLKRYRVVATAADPAGGEKPGDLKKGKRDWFVAVSGGVSRDGTIDIFNVEMHKGTPDIQMDTLIDVYQTYKTKTIGIEENMFKNLYGPTFMERAKRKRMYPSVKVLTNTTNKVSRILGTQPVLTNRTVRFARHLMEKVPLFFAQFDEFPGADFDDGPDAVEMLIRLLEAKKIKGTPKGVGGTSYWKSAA